MNKVTIPGNKKTKSKTFKVGEVYLYQIGMDWIQYIGKIIEINDKQIVFESIFSKKIHRASVKQFSSITKTAERATTKSNKRKLFEQIFFGNFKRSYLT